MSEFARTMLPPTDFTPQVQALRRYIHESLGWDYRASANMPAGFHAISDTKMLRSETSCFDYKGEVRGQCYDNQKFTLTDVTARRAFQTNTSEMAEFILNDARYNHLSAQDDIYDNPFDATDGYNAGFQGVVLTLPHFSKFFGRTLICSDKGRLNPKTMAGKKRVGFVSSEFEKKFEVYSHDQVQARALITPDFMERLNAFHDDYLGRHVQCAFAENNFIVMLNIDDRFDFSKDFRALDYKEASSRIIHELGSIFYLLEKVQALQARIGAAGEQAVDKARGEYYRSLLESLIPAIKASEASYKPIDKALADHGHTASLFSPLLQGLLRPRF